MKNRTLVEKLRQFNPNLKVSLKAFLQNGCKEIGEGSGEYEGCIFTQEYTTDWNDGYLIADISYGYTVGMLIDVLLQKTLSKISDSDFIMSTGELSNGYTKYHTTWEEEEPDGGTPSDGELYRLMDIDDADFKWQGASFLDIEIHYITYSGDSDTLSFSLSSDESDNKPDSFDKKASKIIDKEKAKKAPKKAAKIAPKKAAKKAPKITPKKK
jgi:hypothetical protein